MRTLTLLLALWCCVFPCLALAGPRVVQVVAARAIDKSTIKGVRAKARPPRSLYLVATGPNNAVAERYLNALCKLLSEEKGNVRYRTVAIYRTGGGLEDLAQQLFADPNKRESPDSKALDVLGQAIVTGGHYCVGDEAAASADAATDMVQVEWMPDGAFRVQKATVRPKQVPALGPVQYVTLVQDPNAVARAIGVASFELDLEKESRVTATWSAPDWFKCTPTSNDCVLVTGKLDVSVTVEDSHWLRGRDIEVRAEPRCEAGGGKKAGRLEVVSQSALKTAKGYLRTFSLEAVRSGVCDLDIALSYGGLSVSIPIAPRISMELGGAVFVPLLGRRILFTGVDQTHSVFTMRAAPFVDSDSWQRFMILLRGGEPAQFVTGREVTALGERMSRVLPNLDLNITPSAQAPYAKRLSEYLLGRDERLGYELLEIKPGDFVPLCTRAANQAFGNSPLATAWASQCRRQVSKGRSLLGTHGSPAVREFLIRPANNEHISAFPELQRQDAAHWQTYPGNAGVPDGGSEKYLISGQSSETGGGAIQSVPTSLTVKGTKTTAPSLDLHLGVAAGGASFGGPRRFALGAATQIQGTFNEYFSADLSWTSLWRIPHRPERASLWLLGVGGSARLGYLMQMAAGVSRGDLPFSRTVMFDIGGGYMVGEAGYLRVQMGRGWTASNGFSFALATGAWLVVKGGPIYGTLTADFQLH